MGSGFGGAVVASRLASAGFRVKVIERGPWRDTLPVRSAAVARRSALPAQAGMRQVLRKLYPSLGPGRGLLVNKRGLLELHALGDFQALCSSSVGGGSHVWSALIEEPAPSFWEERAPGLSAAAMAPHYARVFAELEAVRPHDVQPVPNHPGHAWAGHDFFATVADADQPAMGFLFPDDPSRIRPALERRPLDYRQPEGLFGSESGAKSTVDALYLLPAMTGHAVEVLDLCAVEQIHRAERGYVVGARDLLSGELCRYGAPVVVLAAGALNTLRLLFHSREAGSIGALPALGHGIGTNGDVLASWAVRGEPSRDAAIGTPLHGRIRIRGHEDAGYFVIGGSEVPPLPAWLRRRVKAHLAGKYTVIGMGRDSAAGVASYAKGRMTVRYDREASPVYRGIYDALDALARNSGWPVKFSRGRLLTAHALGGCRIAGDEQAGVVDGRGQVHGHPGLFIADGSALPAAPGVPPSLSIAAWASRVAEAIAEGAL